MGGTVPVRTWEEASAPAAVRLARRFEAAWRDAPGRRPDPDDFLPDKGPERPAPAWRCSAPTWPCGARPARGSTPPGIAPATPTSTTIPWSR